MVVKLWASTLGVTNGFVKYTNYSYIKPYEYEYE